MVNETLVKYIDRRLNMGDALSDIRRDLEKGGYTGIEIDEAVEEVLYPSSTKVGVLSVNLKKLPKKKHFDRIKFDLKRHAKLLYFLGILLFASLVSIIAFHTNFSDIDWKHDILVSLIYAAAFLALTIVESIFIYSVHYSSQAHTIAKLYFTKILIAVTIGQIFTFIVSLSINSQQIWLPVLLGNLIFAMFLVTYTSSTFNELIASSLIFFSLTFLFYILIVKIYTRAALLKLLGFG